MQCVSAQGVSWSTATGQIIIDKVSISLGREKTGLVGQNGSGKTTLIRLLVGELEPSSGGVERFCKLAYVRQSFELNPDDSVAEVLGISEQLSAMALIDSGATDPRLYDAIQNDWNIANEARVELSRFGLSGVPFDRRMRDLSGAKRQRFFWRAFC